jgi:hypothetical protein
MLGEIDLILTVQRIKRQNVCGTVKWPSDRKSNAEEREQWEHYEF